MTARELDIPGAWEITPQLHHDDRGVFFEWFTDENFRALAGHRFDLRQTNCSVSAAGVLRGAHFAQVPPGQAKYALCPRGAVYDVVVDIRVGSPTFGQWDGVELSERNRRSMYIAEGLAHAFLALEPDSTLVYLCSAPFTPDREHAISPVDPAIGIDWPLVDGAAPRMSERDRDAPSLEQVHAAGLLPSWEETRDYIEGLRTEGLRP